VCGGDTVRLSLTAGRVAQARDARALQDGQLGQRVAVRTAASPQPIMARVTGAGTVEVE
jgi:flagella basal body P-ring formation protein FlgA